MKLYICINQEPMQGYLHIDPMPKGDVPAFTGTLDQIAQVCDKAECEEIIASEMLDYINIKQIDDVIKTFASLLRHDGEMVLGGNDIEELSRMSFLSLLKLEDVNNILYGDKFRKAGLYSADFIRTKLEEHGLEILNITLNTYKFTIRCKRP